MDKKKVKHGIITAALAAGMITNAAADDPAALLQQTADDADEERHTLIVSAEERGEYAVYLDELVELTGMDKLRDQIIHLPLAVRAVVLLPLWAIGEVAFAVAGAFSAALAAPAGQLVLGFLAQLGILLAVFLTAYKLIFPKTPVKELFSKRKFPWLLAAAAAVTIANLVLEKVWDHWGIMRIILMAAVGYIVLSILWARLCAHLPGPKRERKKLEYSFS